MTSVKQHLIFSDYLKKNKAEKGKTFTHTRIGDKTAGIYAGSFNIEKNTLPDFWKKYYNHVF